MTKPFSFAHGVTKMFRQSLLLGFCVCFLSPSIAYGRIYVSPFVSVNSTKGIQTSKSSKDKEDVTTTQRTTYGINAGVSFWRIFSLQLSVGRSQLDKTMKTQNAADEYGEIDFEQDLNMDTSDPEAEIRKLEITDKARVGVVLDPGFWIFIARAKAGVQATKRSVELTQNQVTTKEDLPITYKPTAGAGFGVRLGPRMKAMAEYNLFFYKFPDTKTFEREVAITYSVALGGGGR
jgi:hypothetical protein